MSESFPMAAQRAKRSHVPKLPVRPKGDAGAVSSESSPKHALGCSVIVRLGLAAGVSFSGSEIARQDSSPSRSSHDPRNDSEPPG